MRFNVTYEIVTPESAEHGDCESRGFILEDARLRDALDSVLETRTSRVEGILFAETDGGPVAGAQWVTIGNGMEFETGAYESRAIHFPDNLTAASRSRVCRLLESRIGFRITG